MKLSEQKLSEPGIGCLKHLEGFRSRIYPDADGWAIGFGCQVDHATWCDREIDESQAESLMKFRLRGFEAAVNKAVRVPLKQYEYDALVIFAYNVGTGSEGFCGSTLVKLLNAGEPQKAVAQFCRWRFTRDKKGNKVESKNLKARRALERRIFLGEQVKDYNS